MNSFQRATILAMLVGVLSSCQSRPSQAVRPEHDQASEPRRALDTTTPAAIAGRPLLAGQPAPDFRLAGASGVTLHLADVLQDGGPVMLIFYTDHYCRVCLDVLKSLETSRPAWQASGARLIAIARQSAADAAASAQQTGARYDFLADSDGRVARAYGIWPMLPGRLKIRQTPVTAFIVEPNGLIRWSGSALAQGQPAVDVILGQLPQ